MQNRSAVLEPSARLAKVEATNLKKVIDTQVDSAIFETDNKDVCGVSRASCQWLKQCVQRCSRTENVVPASFQPSIAVSSSISGTYSIPPEARGLSLGKDASTSSKARSRERSDTAPMDSTRGL